MRKLMFKKKATLALDLLEQEMEVISKDLQISFKGGSSGYGSSGTGSSGTGSSGYLADVGSDGQITYDGGTLNEVTIVGSSQTYLLSQSHTFFVSTWGDKLTYNTYEGTTVGSAGTIFNLGQTYTNDSLSSLDLSIGNITLSYLTDGGIGLSVSSNGTTYTGGISIDNASIGEYVSTGPNGFVSGSSTTYTYGGGALMAVLGGVLCLVTDGAALPLFAL